LIAGEEVLAQEAFARLSQTTDPVLSTLSLPLGPDGEGATIAYHLNRAAAAQASWNAENPILTNPAPAPGMPQVIFVTDQGEIEITLYMDRSPIHVKNILKLASEGFYDNTLFHRVVRTPSMWIVQGGDPNTVEGAESTWGQGGPGYDQTPEKNGLVHARGFISAAAPGAGARSSGSQFFFTLGPCHFLDGRHTIFGQITNGLDVVEGIGKGEVRPPAAGLRDLPVEPIKVLSTRTVNAKG
jgi:cyclophilin family peptidyl-prolyl cis-trans isomerase